MTFVFVILDVADLETKENVLDHMIHNCTRQLRMLTEDSENARYPFGWTLWLLISQAIPV